MLCRSDGLSSVCNGLDTVTVRSQNRLCDFQIDRIVIHNKDIKGLGCSNVWTPRILAKALFRDQFHPAFSISVFKRDRKRENASLPVFASKRDFTAQRVNKTFCDSKAKAAAPETPRQATFGLLETVEDTFMIGLFNADAAILDFELDLRPSLCLRKPPASDGYAPCLGELNGISCQVYEDLANSVLITEIGADTCVHIVVER